MVKLNMPDDGLTDYLEGIESRFFKIQDVIFILSLLR